jgi:hypothetical protein
MNMRTAAINTANALGCRHPQCPRPVLCSERCADREPRRGWALSPETERALKEIDDNQREAWRRAPTTFFD